MPPLLFRGVKKAGGENEADREISLSEPEELFRLWLSGRHADRLLTTVCFNFDTLGRGRALPGGIVYQIPDNLWLCGSGIKIPNKMAPLSDLS